MNLPDCDLRHKIDAESRVFFCAHPRVHARDNLVTDQICKICRMHSQPPPEKPRPLPAMTSQLSRSAPGGWTVRPAALRLRRHRPPSVAVVIPCHNYGRYLRDAIRSVLAQTREAAEILVVDDASTDNTKQEGQRFAKHGVRYLRVEHRNSQQSRRAGLEATRSEILCFLDVDDMLAADYLEKGLAELSDYRVGVVYSDKVNIPAGVKMTAFPSTYERSLLERQNFMHAGCLVRREALEISQALEKVAHDREGHPDWLLWRRVLADGWDARKQQSVYHYRRHPGSMSQQRAHWGGQYYQRASLARETVTLFIPLAGRTSHWPTLTQYLERQRWPHAQTKLVLFDTSQNPDFSNTVRTWILACDYPDVRHVRQAVGEAGLADKPRRQVKAEVSLAMARIYNRMARELTTDYVWVLEDDILPPADACQRLLEGLDEFTASVSGAYWSRYAGGYVAWDRNQSRITRKQEGLQQVGGNGFGCVVLRGAIVRDTVFTATMDYPAYDNAFYWRLQMTGLAAKVDWSLECEHLQ